MNTFMALNGVARRGNNPRIWPRSAYDRVPDVDLVQDRGFVTVAESCILARRRSVAHGPADALAADLGARAGDRAKLLERDRRSVSLTPADNQLLTSGCAAAKRLTAGVGMIPVRKPTTSTLVPGAARRTRRRVASAEASGGTASSLRSSGASGTSRSRRS